MSLTVRPYSSSDAVNWDNFCANSLQATLLHTRRFLSYHQDRFTDLSLILEQDGKCVGVFPAALSLRDATEIISHPGITYGGLLHQGKLRGQRMLDALKKIKHYYATLGFAKLLYKVVPIIYHQTPAQDDVYALFKMGAERIRGDLSSTIDLQHRLPSSERRRRCLKKALKSGIKIVEGAQYVPALWAVLVANLERKHGVAPVHTLAEIQWLVERFTENICCICGVFDNKVIAGIILFITPTTYHAQYIGSSDFGQTLSALDAVFEYSIQRAHNNCKRWFDFGISTEQDGLIFNENLYQFKSEFGAGGTVHEFLELNLIGE